jgi:hypothetical protein
LLALTRSLEPNDTVDAKVQPDLTALSDRSYCSIKLSEEDVAIGAESDNEHPSSRSLAILDQTAKTVFDHDGHTPEPEQLSAAHVRATIIKRKKKKGTAAPKLQSPIEPDFEYPAEKL